jgi:hypothetical protein
MLFKKPPRQQGSCRKIETNNAALKAAFVFTDLAESASDIS